ncbi:hypothetical protein E3N88_29724 [Mikania micrantha]|uniref:Aminotransferase-like plant mobile domain-containing protein n=1 Tax=Mikania micrantha TaxID=192012 RepID=A0A5N6MJM0_9ASTR|nr:hypothetical protein E3N88_29724 [Mikania micrantha]
MDAHFTSGPLNNDLLWLSGSHRGDYYFQNPDRDDGILRIRCRDQDFWKHLKSHPIPENVMEFITLAGFGGNVVSGVELNLNNSQITTLFENLFNWRPYENVFHLLPGICMSGQASWRSETYLIFWEIVEPHLPSRVMRQFRMFQPIPVNTLFGEQEHIRLHKISSTSGRNVSWLQKHNQYVLSWVGRHNNIVTAEFTDSCVASPEYMQWYLPRTILYTIDPRHHQQNQHGFPNDGGTLQMTWDIMSQIDQRTGEDFIRDMASQAMRYGHAQNVEAEAETEPVINSPHRSSMDRSSSYHPNSPSQNFGEVGTSSQHFSQFGTQNYEDAGPSGYNPLQNYEFQQPDFSQDFFSPSLLTPFYPPPPLDTPPTPGFRHLPDMRPPRDRSLSLEFDLNTTMDYTNEDNDDNDNIATRRGRCQIRRPGCGTD